MAIASMVFALVLVVLLLVSVGAIPFTNTPVDIHLGKEQGLSAGSSISNDNLQKIMQGVESGNKDNIYFYGLLKLYGISVSKDPRGAAEQFMRASKLGHAEATTAMGVMKMRGDDGKKEDFTEAVKYFREGVALGDMVSRTLQCSSFPL